MPEVAPTQDTDYTDQIPRFVLPPELSNQPPEPEKPASPAAPPAAPPTEAKPVAEAATTEPVKDEKPEGKETTGTDLEKQSTRRFERRIDRATRRAAEAQARAELLERENAELKAKSAPPESPGAPKLEDFSDIPEYAKAYAAHETDKALKDYQQKQTQAQAQAAQTALVQSWEAKTSRGISKYDDFEEVVGDLKPSTLWSIAIMEAENGEDIAHYLGTHSKEAQRIIALSPVAQIREIGKLEAKLALQQEAPKTPSKAPPPISPVTGEAAPATPDLGAPMPFEQYLKLGNKMFWGR